MRIICPKCGTEYFLEGDQLEQEGTPVQCSACEHTFTVYAPAAESPRTPRSNPTTGPGSERPEPLSTPPAPPPEPVGPTLPRSPTVVPPPPPVRKGSAALFLAQGDRVYKVKDIATLQRWVVEKRVLPGDRISNDGKSWEVVSERADLRAFFSLIDQLKAAKRALKTKTREMKAVSHEAEVARRAAIEAAAAIPGPNDDESTVRPKADSGEIPDVMALSGDHSVDPEPILRAASQSMSGSNVVPESVPALTSVSEEDIAQSASHSFFDAPAESLHSAETPVPPNAAMSDSLYDVRSTPVPDAESPSFGRMHEMETSGSFVKTSAPTDLPEDQTASSPNLMTTRPVPVSRSPAPPEVNPAAATPTGPTAAVGPAPSGETRSDFDPDQTFSDMETYSPRGGAGFYIRLLLLVGLVGGGMWYFLVGPGRSMVFGDDPGLADASDAEGDASADAVEPVTEEEPVTEGTEAPTEEVTPEPVTPEPPTPRVEPPTPSTRPEATPRPQAEPRADHLADADRSRDRGDFRSAATSYGKALEADPRSFRAALQLGWMNLELGKNSAGITAFKKALALNGSSAEARYGLGLAYQASGKRSAAKTEYERALDLEPDGRDAREIRAILSQLQ